MSARTRHKNQKVAKFGLIVGISSPTILKYWLRDRINKMRGTLGTPEYNTYNKYNKRYIQEDLSRQVKFGSPAIFVVSLKEKPSTASLTSSDIFLPVFSDRFLSLAS